MLLWETLQALPKKYIYLIDRFINYVCDTSGIFVSTISLTAGYSIIRQQRVYLPKSVRSPFF